jgi:hypothetical protein
MGPSESMPVDPPGPPVGGGSLAFAGGHHSSLSGLDHHQLHLDTKISTKDLPKWEGNYHAVIDWFYNIQCYTDMGKLVALHLESYLLGTLESRSLVQHFYNSRSANWKLFMRSSFI